MKKLLYIIPPLLLLTAVGALMLCKHRAEQFGIDCLSDLDSDL
mgnify:CR=1 FL=1